MRARSAHQFGLLVALALPAGAAPIETPQLLSPGDGREEARVATACPTFSWTEVEGARGYTLVVYRVGEAAQPDDAPPAESVLRTELPARADSWTPSLEKCLQAGRYAWIVGALEEGHRLNWSGPGIFRVIGPERGQPSTPEEPERLSTFDGASAPPVRSRAVSDQRAFSPTLGWQRPLAAPAFAPDSCNGGVFTDVPIGHPYCAWIEKLAADQIAGQCADGLYCPENPVTRGQLAMFMERSMRGTDAWRPEQGDGAAPNSPPAGPALTSLATAGDVGRYPSITMGSDGLGLISYRNASSDLEVAHCSNIDCSVATTASLASVNNEGYFTSITIGADGLGLISYWDGTNGDLKVARCADVNCTSLSGPLTALDSVGDVGWFTSITIGTDGYGLISYYDNTTFDLKVAHCSDASCSTATITPLDTGGDVGKFTSITIGGDGYGLISYYDDNNDDLKVAHCSDVLCSAATITSLDTAAAAGAHTSITIGADGLGLVSYRDVADDDLKVAHCSNVDCSLATFDSLDTGGIVGLFTSITVGADGLGLISYYDNTNFDLKVAHCSNVNCTDATITTLDDPTVEAVDAGQFSALTIGADGLGLISYRDATNNDLKVAHCSNVLCAPYFRRR